eukprot:gb/GEZN01001005.1/.p1 GENE.gb/GEZN01001005.1/~~gb/GEZN01001005.1/.p1  ORF type:complete len:918 (+),score=114.87 gb/GEZN01001005.1/:511-3264(+)
MTSYSENNEWLGTEQGWFHPAEHEKAETSKILFGQTKDMQKEMQTSPTWHLSKNQAESDTHHTSLSTSTNLSPVSSETDAEPVTQEEAMPSNTEGLPFAVIHASPLTSPSHATMRASVSMPILTSILVGNESGETVFQSQVQPEQGEASDDSDDAIASEPENAKRVRNWASNSQSSIEPEVEATNPNLILIGAEDVDMLNPMYELHPYNVVINNSENNIFTIIEVDGPDVQGVLASTMMALSVNGLNIASMEAKTTEDGTLKNTYRVQRNRSALPTGEFDQLLSLMRRALLDPVHPAGAPRSSPPFLPTIYGADSELPPPRWAAERCSSEATILPVRTAASRSSSCGNMSSRFFKVKCDSPTLCDPNESTSFSASASPKVEEVHPRGNFILQHIPPLNLPGPASSSPPYFANLPPTLASTREPSPPMRRSTPARREFSHTLRIPSGTRHRISQALSRQPRSRTGLEIRSRSGLGSRSISVPALRATSGHPTFLGSFLGSGHSSPRVPSPSVQITNPLPAGPPDPEKIDDQKYKELLDNSSSNELLLIKSALKQLKQKNFKDQEDFRYLKAWLDDLEEAKTVGQSEYENVRAGMKRELGEIRMKSGFDCWAELENQLTTSLYTHCQQILPGLYIGGEDTSMDRKTLQDLHVAHILTCSKERPKFPHDFSYLVLAVDDKPMSDIYCSFGKCYDFISDGLEKGGAVLVHCEQGISRSAAIAIAYVMRRFRLKFCEANVVVRRARPIICPNSGFVRQLVKYEGEVAVKGRRRRMIHALKPCHKRNVLIPPPITPGAPEGGCTSSASALPSVLSFSPAAAAVANSTVTNITVTPRQGPEEFSAFSPNPIASDFSPRAVNPVLIHQGRGETRVSPCNGKTGGSPNSLHRTIKAVPASREVSKDTSRSSRHHTPHQKDIGCTLQ